MTSIPSLCSEMMTSLPSSPAPRSMTLVAVGDKGVPRRKEVFITRDSISHKYGSRNYNNFHADNTKPYRFCTGKNTEKMNFVRFCVQGTENREVNEAQPRSSNETDKALGNKKPPALAGGSEIFHSF